MVEYDRRLQARDDASMTVYVFQVCSALAVALVVGGLIGAVQDERDSRRVAPVIEWMQEQAR